MHDPARSAITPIASPRGTAGAHRDHLQTFQLERWNVHLLPEARAYDTYSDPIWH